MRVAALTLNACPWYLRPFFWRQRRRYGAPLIAALVWARLPRLFLGVAALHRLLDSRISRLPPALRAIVMARVSQLNGCRFCVDLNSATVLARGIGEDKLLALESWRAGSMFDERERSALAYAEAVTLRPDAIDDAIFDALRRHFDETAIVELTALIAFQNMSSKFNSALGLPPQGFCRLSALAGRRGSDTSTPDHDSREAYVAASNGPHG